MRDRPWYPLSWVWYHLALTIYGLIHSSLSLSYGIILRSAMWRIPKISISLFSALHWPALSSSTMAMVTSAGRPGLRGCFATPFLEGSLLFSGCLLGSFKGLSSCGAYFHKSIPDYSFGACGFSLLIRYEYHDDMTESIL